ncbi:MAG: HAD family hydrolase [Clostridiales bacterium]|jgi:Cof subfamily protein (haloacid dehalogenase superfamily)|nr:HAD family hydrolase [Clostridiales bacterium]MDR2750644.1 HAD family hydrolase [Clostridiales bacterium]
MAVLDIDGTIVTTYKQLTRRTKSAIGRLVQKGIPVCLCTGRNVASTLPVARKLGLKTPCMCVDGLVMHDLAERKTIYENVLTVEATRAVLEIAESRNVNIEVVTWGTYDWLIKDKSIGDIYSIGSYGFSANLIFEAYKRMFGIRYVKSLDSFKEAGEKVYQVVAMGEPLELEAIQEELAKRSLPKLSVRLMWGNQLFITGENAGKYYGLKLLCDHYGIALDEVVAVGDDLNDLDMIQAAGFGVAMENGNPQVKAAAGMITKPNSEDGAALALEKLFCL